MGCKPHVGGLNCPWLCVEIRYTDHLFHAFNASRAVRSVVKLQSGAVEPIGCYYIGAASSNREKMADRAVKQMEVVIS